MPNKEMMFTCDMCGSKYQFGNHVYDGKRIPRYKLDVCMTCYEGNWDGWAPHFERRLEDHLKNHNIPPPERNEKGWYPRD